MGQITRTEGYGGLLVPDERIAPATWASDTADYTEAGPRPGQAVPALSTTRAALRTHGSQGDTSYNVQATRGGYGPNAAYSWSQVTAGTETARRGWNSPNFAQDLLFIGGGTTADELAGTPTCVTLASGRMVWIYVLKNTAHTPDTYAVCRTYTDLLTVGDAVGTDASTVIIHNDAAGTYYDTADYFGSTPDGLDCVCARWDDELSIVQLWVRVVGPYGDRQFFLFESPDAVTWTLRQRECCESAFTENEVLRAPAVAKVGGVTTILQLDNDNVSTFKVHQLISYDGGRNFKQPHGTATTTYQEIALCEHLGTVVAAARNGTTDAVHTGILGSLADDFALADLTDMESPNEGYDLTLCSLNGLVWFACIDASGLDVTMRTSRTGRYDDWLALGYNPLSFESAASGIASNYVKIQPGLGGLILTLAPVGSNVPDALDGHLIAIRCGGWASVTLPAGSDDSTTTARVAFGPISGIGADPNEHATYYPITLPEDLDRGGSPIWTYAPSGSPAAPAIDVSLTNGVRLKAVLTAAGTVKTHQWISAFDCDIDSGIMVYLDGNVSVGTNNDTTVKVDVYDGAQVWGCILRFGPVTSASFTDAGGTDTITLGNVTTRYQYIIAMRRALPGDADAVATLYRSTTATVSDRFGWEHLGAVDCTTAASGTAANGIITVTHAGSSGATYSSNLLIYALHYRAYCGAYLLDDLATQPEIGAYLYGAPAAGVPMELSDGFKVSFTAGALAAGDTWAVAPQYSFAKEHLYPTLYPSPRTGWRSQGDNVQAILAWRFDVDDAPEGFASTSLGLMLTGINFPEFTIHGLTAAGTWSELADVATYAEFASLTYVTGSYLGATGPYMRPAAGSASASRYIHENELAGATVNIDIGAGAFRKVRILRNTGGYWSSNATASKKCRLFLDPEDWDAAIPATGTFDIWPTRALVMVHGIGDAVYRRIRIVIAANQTATDDYRIGAMVLDALFVFGRGYSFGRTLTRAVNTSLTTSISGVRTATVNGPNPRAVEFGWFEGVDSAPLYGVTDSDYVSISSNGGSSHAVASRHDIATSLDGLHDRLNGPAVPLVYVAKIPYSEDISTPTVVTSPESFIYGRITSAIQVNTLRGEEAGSEVAMVGPVTFEEEV
jgi:hypothetical protein